MKEKKKDKSKLELWQKRLESNQERYDVFANEFERREELFRGDNSVSACCEGDQKKETPHVRNIVSELIEAQVDTSIPQPIVRAKNKQDEKLAVIIEDMIKDELERLPIETLNDMMERTVPLQGGSLFWLEWDHFLRTHTTMGELTLKTLHPKQIVPQDGVYTCIEDMDYIILKLPQTKEYIRRRYGVSVKDEGEEEPELRSYDGVSEASGMVTQYLAYYRNDKNGIGLFSWVNDTVLEDLEDYQARRLRKCKECGAAEPLDSVPLDTPTEDGTHPEGERSGDYGDLESAATAESPRAGGHKKVCPYCGSHNFEDSVEDFETVNFDRISAHGVQIPGIHEEQVIGADGLPMMMPMPTKIPYYKPDIYPVILQKNVSVHGQLLGDSDADKIETQQNTSNRLAAKFLDSILKAGSFAILPNDATVRTDNEDMKYVRIESPAERQMFDVITMMPDPEYLNSILTFYNMTYEEARQNIGITDSFQGRQDPTATSGKAKEFAAQQSAGRLESKRVMKEACYQQLFEAMFKFKLAYADEPRTIRHRDERGNVEYDTFDRYDFLSQDAAGEWYWNDQFIFGVDSATPLSKDREAMWQELRMNLQTGAFGDPTQMDTLILFWQKMDDQHYPGAADTKKYMEQMKQQMMMQQQQQMMMQQQQQAAAIQAERESRAMEAEAKAVADILKGAGKNGGEKTQKTGANK